MLIKRISRILVMIFVFGLCTVCANADEIIEIQTADEFMDFLVMQGNSASARLACDIDLSGKTTEAEPYIPVGTFNGSLDGCGYSVSGFYSTVGLFDTIGTGGVVENLGLAGTISGSVAGGIAKTNNGTILNVKTALNLYLTSSGAQIAALNNGTIENCSNIGVIYARAGASAVGGIAGNNSGVISGCINEGTVNGSVFDSSKKANYVGGIAGRNSGSITGSSNSEKVTGNQYVGGIVGDNSGTVGSCINAGEVRSDDTTAGGICGNNTNQISICDNYGDVSSTKTYIGGISGKSSGTLSKCTNHGNIRANNYTGGITGQISNASITECANYGEVNGAQYVGGIAAEVKASDITASLNASDIYGTSRAVGGIAGGIISGPVSVESCFNSGTINPEATHNFLGGICAYCTTENILQVENCGNIGAINGANTAGGIVGGTKGAVKNSYTLYKNVVGSKTVTAENCYKYSQADAVKYTDGTMVTLLGAEDWIQDTEYPIPASVAALPENFTGAIEAGSDVELDYQFDETIAVNLFVTKESCGANSPFDIYPEFDNDSINLFIPSDADLSAITYKTVNINGEELSENTVDLSDGKTETVKINNFNMTMKAYKSKLPTVYVSVTSGTFDEVNASSDHSYTAYGDVVINVPETVSAAKGWKRVYRSEEKDSAKPGTMEIRGRGNSSWNTDPLLKKSYQIKLEKKQGLLGMDSAKKWILLQDSVWLVGQKIGLDLAQDFGFSATPKGEFVDAFVDGHFIGNMLLTEKVDVGKGGVNISNLDDEYEENQNSAEGLDLSGGYLLEIDNFTGDDLRILTNGNVVSVKSPEDLASTVTDSNEYSYIKSLVTDLFDAVYGNGIMSDGTSYLDHIDIESFVRYYWHQEFLGNTDCGSGSTFMYKDKDGIDGAIYAGPVWDNDRILGYNSTSDTNTWVAKDLKRNDAYHTNVETFYNALLHRKDFAAYAVWYYENSDIKDVMENAADYIDEYYAYIAESAMMDNLRWKPASATNNFNASNAAKLKNRLSSRAAWIDEHYTELLSGATVGDDIDVEKPFLTIQNYSTGATTSGNVTLRTVDKTGKVIICLYNENGTASDIAVSEPKANIPFSFEHSGAYVKAFYWDINGMVPFADTVVSN